MIKEAPANKMVVSPPAMKTAQDGLQGPKGIKAMAEAFRRVVGQARTCLACVKGKGIYEPDDSNSV
jgi:hypothetical protein